MKITELVGKIQSIPVQPATVSRVVRLSVELSIYSSEKKATMAAVGRMKNEDVQQFAELLIGTIVATRDNEVETRAKAKEELIALFGKEILEHAAVTESRDGFFFSLTGEGKQFRAWYAPFGTVSYNHFDSCGTGCLFSAECDSPEALMEWITPLVARKAEWKSTTHRGSVWIGYESR